MKEPEKARLPGIDLIKTLAIIFVPCVHFSLNTTYYTTPVMDLNMILQTVLRWLFVSCVPLFILSTGYLNAGKAPEKAYFIRILRVLIPYLVISVICLLVKDLENPGKVDLKADIYSIFTFKADGYAWYVNMFIGLYLLAPFLNIVLNSLDRRRFKVLIVVLLVVSALPPTLNPILSGAPTLSWFALPDFWQAVYPLVYYAVGVYIKRFVPKARKSACAAVILGMIAAETLLVIAAWPYAHNNWILGRYDSVFVIVQSIALFLMFYKVDIKTGAIRRTLSVISATTLEIYLFSYLADQHIYPYFIGLSGGATQQEFFSRYFYVIVPLVLVSSFIPAFLVHFIYEAASKAWKNNREKKKAEELPAG